MATLPARVSPNAVGKYYVGTTCIDCDQSRAITPDFHGRTEDGMAFVIKQPVTPEEVASVEEAGTPVRPPPSAATTPVPANVFPAGQRVNSRLNLPGADKRAGLSPQPGPTSAAARCG
ncbi:MAG: ferredoxin [Opitutae bacterium]|nr:ferredoxin [Opitutae bacterium]